VTMENTIRDLAAVFGIRVGTVARADFLVDLKETEPAFAVESPMCVTVAPPRPPRRARQQPTKHFNESARLTCTSERA
jgi:hypothetical protein